MDRAWHKTLPLRGPVGYPRYMKPRKRAPRETVRPLATGELAQVVGGAPAATLKMHVDNPGQTPMDGAP